MAGPSVVVRVLGDLAGLSKTMDDTAKKGESTSKAIGKSFSTMFSTLNATGILGPFSEIFDNLQAGFDQLEEDGHKVTNTFLAVGVGAATAGAALTALGSADQAAHQQLAQAVENTGHSFAQYQDQVEATIKSQEHFGNTAAETENALATLTNATSDPTQALNLMGLAANLAASQHESLTSASTQLARAVNGSSKILKEYGITVPKVGTAVGDFATKADQSAYIVDQLSQKLKGQASAASDTLMGHVHALTAEVEDQVAAFGQKYGPAITAAGTALTVLTSGVQLATSVSKAFRATQEATTAATEAATGATEAMSAAEDAAAVSEGLALAPILLIVAAVAALIAIGYEIGTHWKVIWAGIKAAVVDVWNWIKQNWPYLLGILLGPVGLAAAAIYKHWQDIWNGLKAVLAWLESVWPLVYNFLTKPIVNAANAIVAAFRTAFNTVANLWNGTVGKLSFNIPHWVPFIGGDKFSVPQIPHLAEGGLITQSGLVYAHAGEAITPAPVGHGPAVHIEHAQFNEPVDIDLLVKKVEFALSAGRPV